MLRRHHFLLFSCRRSIPFIIPRTEVQRKEKEKKFLEGDYFFAPSPSMAPNQSCASWRIPSPVGWKASKAV